VTTFYTKKDEVKLKPGQTLGYTSGKGYYAAGTPTPPKPPPSSTPPNATSNESRASPTATRPVAAKTPTTPPGLADGRSAPPRTPEPVSSMDEATRRSGPPTPSKPVPPPIGQSVPFYTRPREVPLKPGQTIAFAAGGGYYAAGRPNPTKASTKPAPSTAKVVAVSTRASTESPLVEHRETQNGRTAVTLSHRVKLEGKPATRPGNAASPDYRTSVRTHPGSTRPRTEGPQGHVASGHHTGPLGWLEGAGSSLVHAGEGFVKKEVHGAEKVVHAVEGGAKKVVHLVEGGAKTEVIGATTVLHASEGAVKTEVRGAKTVADYLKDHPGSTLEMAFIIAQFTPYADVVVDAAVSVAGYSGTTLGIFTAATGLNYVTGHFTVGSTVVDATFSFPGVFPGLTEDELAQRILKDFAAAVGATGYGAGFVADKRG
jgi:hypothetical protein